MNKQEILKLVALILEEHMAANPENVTLETNLIDDLGADEFDINEIILHIEEEFDVDFPDNCDMLYTVGDIVEYLEERL